MKKHFSQSLLCLFWLFLSGYMHKAQSEEIGFYLKDGQILESNGSLFIPRGINYSYAWQRTTLNATIPAIANTGANCVRIGLSNGKRWNKCTSSDVQSIISLCKTNKLIAVVQIHDCTGYAEQSGSVALSTAVDYWKEIKSVLIGQEKYVIINIANEPLGNDAAVNDWASQHVAAVKSLRDAGLKHLLVCDAANWGQDWKGTAKSQASTVINGDTLKNTLVSVHMYDVYKDDATVNAYMKAFADKKFPLLVGEFASDHGPSKPVAAQAILDRAKQYGIGYIGWSWCGNSPAELAGLDIAAGCNEGSLSTWGKLLINGTNGIKGTSIPASVFTGKIILPTPTLELRATSGAHNIEVAKKGRYVRLSLPALPRGNATIDVYDMHGQRIRHYRPAAASSGPAFAIDGNDLRCGNYMARIIAGTTVLHAPFMVVK